MVLVKGAQTVGNDFIIPIPWWCSTIMVPSVLGMVCGYLPDSPKEIALVSSDK